jgi:hypothetical protein
MPSIKRFHVRKTVFLLLLLAVLATTAAIVHAATTVTLSETGSLSATGPTISTRIFRDAIPSTCGGKAFPGIFGGPQTYNVHGPYGPLAEASCITINFDVGTCGTNAHAVAYLNGFNSSDLSQGYLGDIGSSVTQPFSFPVPAGESFAIVVMSTAAPADCTYSFTSSPFLLPDGVSLSTECAIFDGRINNKRGLDCAAPIVIFTPSDPEETVDIYSTNPTDAKGYMDIRMTLAEIEEAGVPTDRPMLLAEVTNHWTGQPLQLWRLTSGELQINTFYADGKAYTVAWPFDAPAKLYHLDS